MTVRDEFVRAIVISRTHAVGVKTSLLADLSGADILTKMPEEIRLWEETLETTSGKIRQAGS